MVDNLALQLVSIKGSKIDSEQLSTVSLVDFITIMLDRDYPSEELERFIQRHNEYLRSEETIKVFILKKKFSLMMSMFRKTGVSFNIEYFLMALTNNAFDIAIYLMALYEDEIVAHIKRVLETLVISYSNSNQFIKAKIYLSKLLLPNFTFNAAKRFLVVVQQKVLETTLEKNLFTHCPNPLLAICLLYEFLELMKRKFFSLNNQCTSIMTNLRKLALEYTMAVEDENFLSE